jgi:hypothetical protein
MVVVLVSWLLLSLGYGFIVATFVAITSSKEAQGNRAWKEWRQQVALKEVWQTGRCTYLVAAIACSYAEVLVESLCRSLEQASTCSRFEFVAGLAAGLTVERLSIWLD